MEDAKTKFLKEIKAIKSYDLEKLGEAYDVAYKQHNGQKRKSGEPYIIHPEAVAKILAELGMDEDTLIAGLLHDVIEDTDFTPEMVEEKFGSDVRHLVEGVTKLGTLVFETKEEVQAENMRKMFLAMSKDIRVLIIKLADRLHNLRTINYMSQDKIKLKCQETLDIYAPLASRLGIYSIKFELEDIALKCLHPETYEELKKNVNEKKIEREKAIKDVISEVEKALKPLGIEYTIYGRSKHFYSIYKKMQHQKKSLDEIFDLTAIRIIVNEKSDCYAVLGVVHNIWTPIPGRFKDYIAMPKMNMYQSIHTTVIGSIGRPFEVQIRTKKMHELAEYGIAAHWKYKEGKSNASEEADDIKLAWLRQTLEWQKDVVDSKEFMETLKIDLFTRQVFVFTPKGDVIELPAGATPLDFAFKIHTQIGCKCVGAKVNGKMVTIDHVLNNGDIVDIITSANSSGPSIDWLNMAKSSSARSKIRQWLKSQNKNDIIDKGKEVLDKYVRKKGHEPKEILKGAYLSRAAKKLNLSNVDELYSQVSYGGAFQSKVYNLLLEYYKDDHKDIAEEEQEAIESVKKTELSKLKEKENRRKRENPGIVADGYSNLKVRMAKCCNPVPGDEICGYVSKGRGIMVHRSDCPNLKYMLSNDPSRKINVKWDYEKLTPSYLADISVISTDTKGVFTDLSRTCEGMDIKIAGINANSTSEGIMQMDLTLNLTHTAQMNKLIGRLKGIENVIDVYRK